MQNVSTQQDNVDVIKGLNKKLWQTNSIPPEAS